LFGNGTIEHYYTTGRVTPNHLSESDKTAGFSNITVAVVNGQIVCSFSRLKTMNTNNYFDVKANPSFYILTAMGSYSSLKRAGKYIKFRQMPILSYLSLFLQFFFRCLEYSQSQAEQQCQN